MGIRELVTLRSPKSPVSEIFRTLRTSIKFASFSREMKSIVFTSAGPGEGKSTIVANLAVTLAQSGNKVLILEGDLRNPTVHRIFNSPNISGLTNILVDNTPYREYLNSTGIENLDVITCGPKPPNPAELLGSARMQYLIDELKKDYDYILIDSPPVVVVTDAAQLASFCDGTVLVVSSGEAVIAGAQKAKELLLNVKANIIGVVLNKVKREGTNGYYSYYHYYYDGTRKSRKTRRVGLFRRGITHV